MRSFGKANRVFLKKTGSDLFPVRGAGIMLPQRAGSTSGTLLMSQESSTGHPGSQPSGPTARFEMLIAEARLGSEAAIGRLIEECRGFLLAVANRELDSEFRPKIGASDLVQETMLSAQRCIADFQGGTRDELLAWLRVILVNDIKEARRRYLTAQRDVRREATDGAVGFRRRCAGRCRRRADADHGCDRPRRSSAVVGGDGATLARGPCHRRDAELATVVIRRDRRTDRQVGRFREKDLVPRDHAPAVSRKHACRLTVRNSPTHPDRITDDLPDDRLAAELEAIDEAVAGDGKTPSEPDHSELDRGLEMLGLIDRVRKHAVADARPVAASDSGATHEPTLISGSQTGPSKDGDPGAFAVTQIGEYEILDEIARGGMGVVFRARHRSLERIVALKMMLAGPFAHGEEQQRFRIEAEAAAQLDHPGIVPVHDVGEYHGLPYFTMGYVEGENLQSRIRRDPLEPRVAAELTRQIADAVASAHDQGVIHRDIKPANVLIDWENRTRITDFGLARRTNSASDLTGTGQVLGTPGYMPPEQAAGRPDGDGRLADVYAIGATFYCMLTGQPPFRAASAVDTLRLVIEREPVSPRDLIPTIPGDVATICLKCLHKDPQRRYASAAELSADLKRFLNGEPILARPVSRTERVLKWSRRHPLVASLLALLMVALLALMVGGAWYQNRLSESRGNTVNHLYRTLTSEAEFLNEMRPVGYGPRVRDLIRQARVLETSAVDPDHLRQLAVRSLGHAVAGDPITISGFDAVVTAANITEDGRFLLAGLETGELAVIDLTNHEEVQRIPAHAELISSIEFQGDDAIRLETPFCREWSVWTRGINSEWTRESQMESLPTSDFLGMVLTPDGQTVVGFSGLPQESSEQAEWRYRTPGDVVTASNLHVPIRGGADSIRFAVMPSGATEAVDVPDVPVSLRIDVNDSHLAVVHSWVDVSEYQNTLSIIDLANPAEVRTLPHDCGALFNVALSRDGRFVACSGHRGAEVLDGVSGTSLARLDRLGRCSIESFTGDAGDILLRNESEYIWFSTRRHETLARFPVPDDGSWLHICPSGKHALWLGTRDVRILDLTNRERRQIAAHGGIAKGVNFSPDGRLLLSSGGDGVTRVWDVEHAIELYSFSGSLSRFSPDGRLIVSWNGPLQFWDAATGALLAEAPCGFFPNTIRFDPRGSRVAAASVKSGDLGVWEFSRNPNGVHVVERVFHDADGLVTVAFSPSGRRIAYRVGPGRLCPRIRQSRARRDGRAGIETCSRGPVVSGRAAAGRGGRHSRSLERRNGSA